MPNLPLFCWVLVPIPSARFSREPFKATLLIAHVEVAEIPRLKRRPLIHHASADRSRAIHAVVLRFFVVATAVFAERLASADRG